MTNLRKLLALALLLFACASILGAQTLYVQVDLEPDSINERDGSDDEGDDDAAERGDPGTCSILQIDPDGTLTELVSSADILAVTGETSADCSDTGLAVAPDGTIYFTEDTSDDILRRTPEGVLSVFVEEADIDTLIGETADADNGMDVGPDGTLFVADEDCNCIYTVSPDGNTLEIIVTEAAIGAVTGNLSDEGEERGSPGPGICTGSPTADLEGGLSVGPDGTVYFADDGAGCNPTRPDLGGGFDDLDSILRAVPDGVGGYTVSIVADEDDIFADVPTAYPAGFGTCRPSFADLDIDIDLGSDGFLYVLDDGVSQSAPPDCGNFRGGPPGSLFSDDKVLRIDPVSGAVSLIAAAASFGSLSGATDPTNQADLEGGIAFGGDGSLFVGDRVAVGLQPLRGDGPTVNNIFRVATGGSVSVFVSDSELQSLYGPLYPGVNPRLSGGLDAAPGGGSVLEIPVAGGTGLATLMALLGALGLWTVRRRM